jgi:hypothetical protein
MNVFQPGLPFSYGIIAIVFLLGVTFTTVVFGVIAGIVLLICIYSGVIHITPIIEGLGNIVSYFNPGLLDSLINNLRNSLLIEYPDGKPSNTKHIFVFHPHGTLSTTMTFHIGTHITEWSIRPIKVAVLHGLFWLPFANEIFHKMNAVPSHYSSMKAVLDNNESLGLCLGGVREILYTEPGSMKLSIKNKRGIFRLALETGTPLIPVLSYGENELFDLSDSKWLLYIQKYLIHYGVCLPIPTLKSCISWFGIIWNPLKNPIRTVVGEAIQVPDAHIPTDKEIIELRETYFTALKDLYQRTRPDGYKDIEIV